MLFRSVTFVPTHWLRRMLRGIDHGACLADTVARTIGVASVPLLAASLASRQTGTGQGARASRHERFSMSSQARRNGSLAGKTVLLVDDVRTTGSTLRQAAKALREAGAQAVYTGCCAAADPPNRSATRFAAVQPRASDCG